MFKGVLEIDRRIWLLIGLTLLVVFSLVGPCRLAHAQSSQRRQVLVIHSYHRGYKWTDDIMAGIEAGLGDARQNVELQIEYMDTKRLFDETHLQRLYDLYQYKFKDRTFDVILVSDNNAFDFLRAHRDTLFPGTPVVFCGVNFFEDSLLAEHTLFTGVNETLDIQGSLDLALRLHPNTKRVAIVNDTTTTGRRLHENIVAFMPEYQATLEFIFLEDVEMAEVQETVANLPPDSLVLYTLFFRDKAGKFFEYDESVALVAEHSAVPVYGTWDFSLGYGIVGGRLASGYYQGETAGQLALRILQGERVENIPIVRESPNYDMFDYQQLERFNIPTSALPKGSIIINRPVTFYERYKAWIWGTGIGVAILVGIIAVVASVNVKLRHTEGALQTSNRDLENSRASLEQRNVHLQDTVQAYSAYMAAVTEGNLDARLDLEEEESEAQAQEDPLLALGYRLNEMTASLEQMIEQERQQRDLIEAQQLAIQELSMPVIPIMQVPGAGSILVMPLIGSIDTMRAKDLMRAVLAGIREHRARVLILDITGVPIVDSGVANHLNKTIQAARLKGARVIVTGISDAVAETIVDLGIEWAGIETLANLQAGLLAALNRLGVKLSKKASA